MKLIVESGSTKTNWVLVDKNTILKEYDSKGINPYYQTKDEIISNQQEGILRFKDHVSDVKEIFYYGTGITDSVKIKIIEEVLKGFFINVQTVEVNNDLLASARALFGNQNGIACILGTGSNSGHYENQKIVFQIPPLGFWLGDEGSGGHLGKQLVLAYLHNELPKDLRKSFEKKYGQIGRLEILDYAYKQAFPNRYFASFTPFLSENKEDVFIKKMLKNSFNAFLEKYLLKYPNLTSSKVGFVGSIGYYFDKTLQDVFVENNLDLPIILKHPIYNLVKFHSSNL